MKTSLARALGGPALAVALSALAVPAAHAGGPGQIYVYGSTYSQCQANLSASYHSYERAGYEVTGINGCRLTGDGSRYFGDFVANK